MRWLLLLALFTRLHAWEIEQVSESPQIYVIQDFLSEEESDYLIEYAKPYLKRSTVINPVTGLEEVNPNRISYNMSCSKDHNDDVISNIEKRIEEVTTISASQGENINVIKYEVGGVYKPHFDAFPENSKELEKGGQRIATFLIYLNDVESGGETNFPEANVSVTPKKGKALFFYNVDETGALDPLVIHAATPVNAGEKWVATRWLRERAIE